MTATDIAKIKDVLSRAMTVRELIEFLEGQDGDAPVLLSSNYGDRHETEQVSPLLEDSIADSNELGGLYATAYSSSGVAVGEDGDDPVFADFKVVPVILRG